MKLEYSKSTRRDIRSYIFLIMGLIFTWGGATIDPAGNCTEDGHECAPWLVPIAFCIGVLLAYSGVSMLATNKKWGSRLDLAQRRFFWWDTRMSQETQSISLDDVARIKVRIKHDDSDNIFFYDRDGTLMSVPKEEIFPSYEAWARDLATHFPHISVDVEHD